VSVLVPPPGTPGAETTLTAYFNHGVDTGGQSFGACVFDPDGAILTQSGVVGAPAPRPGVVTVTAKGFTESITPACDGTYATGSTSETIEPGSLVTFGFGDQKTAGSGDDFPTSFPGVPAPHFVTLASTDRLTAASPKVSRASDLGVDWTVSGTPLSLESVVVLWTQKSATLTCTFDASAGTGVVPADALLQLDKGSASFAVQSVHEADDGNPDEGGWGIRLLVQMPASTPTGLAVGSATLE